MPSRDPRPHRRAVLVLLVAFLVALAGMPAHALPDESPAASRTFLQLVRGFHGWLVGLWSAEGVLIDPNGNSTGEPPHGSQTPDGGEGMTVNSHG